MYHFRWFLDEKGVDRPSRRVRDHNYEPGGATVKPGTYKVVLNYGTLEDTETITVKSDPRLDISTAATNEIYEAEKEIERMTQVAADAVKQLVESKTIAEDFLADFKKKDKDAYEVQIDSSKAIVKKLDAHIATFLGKEDDRQGITRNAEVTVLNRIYLASSYVNSRPNGLTATENQLLAHAEEELKTALEKVNTFFTEDWAAYETQMKQVELSPFKEIKSFQLE